MLTLEAASTASTGDVRVLRRTGDLQPLADAWDGMADRAACPAASAVWCIAAARAFGLEDRLRVVTVEWNGVPGAIAPLVSENSLTRPWQLIGLRQMGEPADFLSSHPGALKSLVDELAHLGAPLLLGRIPARSTTVDALHNGWPARRFFLVRTVGGCPRIALDPSWADPERHMSADRREQLRRARRRAAGAGEVRFECHAPRPSEVAPLLEKAFAVEAAGWKGRSLTALAVDSARGRFIRLMAEAAAHRGWLRVGFLCIGDAAVAMEIGLDMGGSRWVVKIGYDDQYRRCSPGTLLTMEMIRSAAVAGLASYEFLGSEESWLRPWTQDSLACVSVRVCPPRLPSMVAHGFEGARSTWQRARSIVRAH
ncbi:MAG: GNAT family N-acetyltransferase [Candidatus Polarisedimenticolia bacterium]